MVGQLWNGVRFNQYGTLDCLEVYDRSEKLDEKWWETEKQYLKLGRLFHLFIFMHLSQRKTSPYKPLN